MRERTSLDSGNRFATEETDAIMREEQLGNLWSAAKVEGKRGSAEEGVEGMADTVVGVGASAGKLETLRLLLAHLPSDAGFSVVLVQHVNPKHYSEIGRA